jgi:hypothetical protein
MSDRSTQVLGAGSCQDIDGSGNQAARLVTLSANGSGKLLVHNGHATLDLAWKQGADNTVDCANRGDADGTIAPGVTIVLEVPQGFVSFLLVARTNDVAVCEVR